MVFWIFQESKEVFRRCLIFTLSHVCAPIMTRPKLHQFKKGSLDNFGYFGRDDILKKKWTDYNEKKKIHGLNARP